VTKAVYYLISKYNMFMDMGDFTDFHKVKDMHFDIPKL